MIKFLSTTAITSIMALSFPFTAVHATPDKDAKWHALIAAAVQHGGVETISGPTGSYVFFDSRDNIILTFTRSLNNKIKLVCGMPPGDTPLVNVCINWDTEKLIYNTRASVNDSWVVSNNPPSEPIPITEIIDTFITSGTFHLPSYYSHRGSHFSSNYYAHHPHAGRGRGNWGHH